MTIKREYQILMVIALPVINAIASTTQNYFNGFGTGHIRMLFVLPFVLIFFYKYYRNTLINNIIMINIIYLSFIVFLSSNLSYSAAILTKYIISTIAFIIGFYYIRSLKDYSRLLKSYLWALLIMVISIVIANIFKISSSDYMENSIIYYGPARVDITMQMSVILLALSPYFIFVKTKPHQKIFTLMVMLVAFIFIMLGIKRTAIAALVIGYLLYIFLSPVKIKLIAKYLLGLLALVLASPLYIDILYQRYQARQESGRFSVDGLYEEGRYFELMNVLNQFIDGTLVQKLFGSELFNYMGLAHVERMLHTDYATIFSGSGLIGLILFVLIYITIYTKIRFFKKIFKKNKLMSFVMAVSFAMLAAELILGVGSTVHGIGVRFYVFLFLGASLGVLSQEYYHHRNRRKNENLDSL